MSRGVSNVTREVSLFLAGALLVAAKLWLVSGQTIVTVWPNYVDESAFLRLGLHLAEGEGLGPYRVYTLIKGPGYPAFVGLVGWLGFPLLRAQHVLYAAACAAVAVGVRRMVPSQGLRLALFALLLWNPITFQAHMLRPLREGIYPAQVLLCIAAALAVANARDARLRRLALAALGLGGAIAWLWLTREEGVWVLPALAIAGAALVADLVRRPDRLARLALCSLAAVVPVTASAALVLHNRVVYGVPAILELRTAEFREACGALLRATPEPPHRLVPLPRATREQLYAVSPTFAELRSSFEGTIGESWVRASTAMVPALAGRGEIVGGWWVWALRSAAARQDWHASGPVALAHYARLAREVNDACETGRLACGPPHHAIGPPLHLSDLAPSLASAGRAALYVVRLDGFTARVAPSRAPPLELELARRATHERPSGSRDERTQVGLEAVGDAYAVGLPVLSVAALTAFAWRGRRLRRDTLVCLAALAVLFVTRLAVIGVVDATSFPAVTPHHLAPAYPVWLTFCGIALAACASAPAGAPRPAAA